MPQPIKKSYFLGALLLSFFLFQTKVEAKKISNREVGIQAGKGKLIFQAGRPGTQLRDEIPQLLSTKKENVNIEKGDFSLLVHASNFSYRDACYNGSFPQKTLR